MSSRKTFKLAAAMTATLAIMQPSVLAAQECIEQDDLSDTLIYAMPLMVDAVSTKCNGSLSPTGFLATNGDSFVAPYAALQENSWTGAFRVLQQFAGAGSKDKAGSDEMAQMLGALPPEALRPFVDAIVVQKLGEEIKTKDCSKIERGMELLAPLPPENAGGLVAFLFDLAKVDRPSVCAYRPE